MASYTIIGGDTKEYGPIWREDVLKWIAEGRHNSQSLAKGETDKAWRTLASFPLFTSQIDFTGGSVYERGTERRRVGELASSFAQWLPGQMGL